MSAETIGIQFLQQYYLQLIKGAENVRDFYLPDATFVYGSFPTDTDNVNTDRKIYNGMFTFK